MSTAVSPLAPQHVPDMPAIAGVRLATAAGRHPLCRAAPTCCWRCSTPAPPRPACSPLEMPVGAGRLVPRAAQGAARRARWWSIPATPTPSPARAAARPTKLTAEIAAKAAGCKPAEIFLASTGVIGEPLDAAKFAPRHGRPGRARRSPATSSPRRKAIMTTDTFPKVATAHGEDRQGDGDHQRHRQGRRHDRARHGDHAVLRLHRRADRGAGACRRCSRTASPTPSTR